MLVGLTLTILFVLFIMGFITGSTVAGTTISPVVDSDLIINGSSTQITFNNASFSFDYTLLTGGIAWLTICITLAILFGIQVLGSGLSDHAHLIVTYFLFYAGIWGSMSFIAVPLLSQIDIFGYVIYIALTMGYAIGVMKKTSESGG